MEMGLLRGLGTLFCLMAFLAVVWWAYSPQRKKYFELASKIPFSGPDFDRDGDSAHADKSDEGKSDE